MEVFSKGDKVSTPYGTGVVLYVRMEPPNYSQAACYSIQLDTGGNSTIIPAHQVASIYHLTGVKE
jgi:hypothetical protein